VEKTRGDDERRGQVESAGSWLGPRGTFGQIGERGFPRLGREEGSLSAESNPSILLSHEGREALYGT